MHFLFDFSNAKYADVSIDYIYNSYFFPKLIITSVKYKGLWSGIIYLNKLVCTCIYIPVLQMTGTIWVHQYLLNTNFVVELIQ